VADNQADKSVQSFAPISWNLLPLSVRSAESLGSFRKRPKSHLFTVGRFAGLLQTNRLARYCPIIYVLRITSLDLKSALETL
jgi:hypothetical protein